MRNLQLILFRLGSRGNHFEPHSPMILPTSQPLPHNPSSTQPLPHNPPSIQPLPHNPPSTQPLHHNPSSTLPQNLHSTHPMPHNLPSTQPLPHNLPSTHPIPHNHSSNQPIPHNLDLPCGIFQSDVESSPGPPQLVCGPPYTLSLQGRTWNTNESKDILGLVSCCLKTKKCLLKIFLEILQQLV